MSVRLSNSSVCLSRAGISSKRLYISSVFLPSGSPTTPNGMAISDGDPTNGCRMQGGYEKSTIFDQYLTNDARQSHSYCGRRIGNCTQAFEWYHIDYFFLGHFKILYKTAHARFVKQCMLWLQLYTRITKQGWFDSNKEVYIFRGVIDDVNQFLAVWVVLLF